MKKVILIILLFAAAGIKAQNNHGKIKVEPIEKAGLEKLIKERNGKALFLNLWATWCVPCREEFPSIVKLASEYKSKGVEFYGISIDFPEETESKIIPFLKSQNANFVSFVNGFKHDEELINMLDQKWSGAIPATFIFDKKGNKVFFLEGKKSYSEFKKSIDAALKK